MIPGKAVNQVNKDQVQIHAFAVLMNKAHWQNKLLWRRLRLHTKGMYSYLNIHKTAQQ